MKTINVTFEDKEHDDLLRLKNYRESWRNFILRLSKK